MIKIAAGCLAVLCFYAFFYRTVVKRWGRLLQPILGRSRLMASYPVRQVDAVGKLAAAGVAQSVFALSIMTLLEIGPGSVLGPDLRADLIILGAILGLGELALASFLCTNAVHLGLLRAADPRVEGVTEWLVQGRGGWMSQFSATIKTAPAWFAITSVCVYVSAEELVFRGLLIELLRGAGAGWAVGVSLVLFVVAQSFNMPSARATLFPTLGAAVIGLTHGIIYWNVPDVLPLMVAHLTFFLGVLGMPTRQESILGVY